MAQVMDKNATETAAQLPRVSHWIDGASVAGTSGRSGTVYDPATGQNYYRLNLDRAMDAIMPADDYGSTSATAQGLGSVSDKRQISGALAKLGDQDFFTFTAGRTGRVTLEADMASDGAANWSLLGGASATADKFSFDVVAGQRGPAAENVSRLAR